MPRDIHAFVGSVGLAGMHGDLWSVEGGNYQVAEKLAKISNANIVASKVPQHRFTLRSKYFDSLL